MIEKAGTAYDVLGCMDVDNRFYNEKANLNCGCFTEVEPLVVTSLNKNEVGGRLRIMPNPVNQRFVILGIDKFPTNGVIIDASGKQVKKVFVKNNNEIESLQDGMYILKLQGYKPVRLLKVN